MDLAVGDYVKLLETKPSVPNEMRHKMSEDLHTFVGEYL